MTTNKDHQGWPFALVFAGALAILVCWVSENLHSRFTHRAEMVTGQMAILERGSFTYDGQPLDLPEFRGRVLFPTLLSIGSRIGVSMGSWFLLCRLATAFALFLAVLRLTPGPWPWRAFGGLLVAGILILSFNHSEQPTDFPDVAFTFGFCALALRGSFWRLALLTLLASTNRESAAFAGVLWCGAHGWPVSWRETAKGVALCALGYGVAMLLRFHFAVAGESARLQTIGLFYVPRFVGEFVRHPTPSSWPILLAAAVAPLCWMLWAQRRLRTPAEHRLIWSACAMGGLTLLFGLVDEIRIFLPSLTILAYAALCTGDRLVGSASHQPTPGGAPDVPSGR